MNTVVVSNEANAGSVSALKQLVFENALDCSCEKGQIARIYCWLCHVKNENESRRHRGSTHVLIRSNEVNGAASQFISILHVLSNPPCIQRRVVVVVRHVDCPAEVADPFESVVDKSNKWIDVSAAVLAPNNRLRAESHGRNGLSI